MIYHVVSSQLSLQDKPTRKNTCSADEVDNLCPTQRVPLSLRVALEQLYCASFHPHHIVDKYVSGKFPNAERFVPKSNADSSEVSFKKQCPVFAAQIALKLARENGLTVPPLDGDGGPADAAGPSTAANAAPGKRRRKRTREETLTAVEECLGDLYDGVDCDAEQIPDSDAATVVEHAVLSAEMARGWEPEAWTQEHLRDVQDLATGRRPPSQALQSKLYKCCVRCATTGTVLLVL